MFTKKQFIYEILIRGNEKGLTGAHVKDAECVIEDATGEIVKMQVGAARAVTLEQIGVLGATLTDTAVALGEAANKVQAAMAAKLDAERRAAELERKFNELVARIQSHCMEVTRGDNPNA